MLRVLIFLGCLALSNGCGSNQLTDVSELNAKKKGKKKSSKKKSSKKKSATNGSSKSPTADCKDSVKNAKSIPKSLFGTFSTNPGKGNRSEKRCRSVTKGKLSFTAKFKVVKGNDISIAQFLNQTTNDIKGGPAEPISQLVADRQSKGVKGGLKADEYRISIQQEDQYCGFVIKKNQFYTLKATVSEGETPKYEVVGKGSCNAGNKDRMAGIRAKKKGHLYYFKYGAYHAGGDSAASEVVWKK